MTAREAHELARLIEVFGNMSPAGLREHVYDRRKHRGRNDPALKRKSRGELIADAVWSSTRGFNQIMLPTTQNGKIIP